MSVEQVSQSIVADEADFKSKKLRINLNQPVKSEQKAEQTEVLQSVDEDRKFVYQATIVRIMKARKVSSSWYHLLLLTSRSK